MLQHLQIFTRAKLEHQEEPFLRLQRLVQGYDVLVDWQRKMNGRFEKLCIDLFRLKILFAQTFEGYSLARHSPSGMSNR